MDVKLRAGYHLGGTSPLPLPATIRSIDAFRPTVSVRIGADATLMLANSWGLTAGLFFEGKGMDGEVTVTDVMLTVNHIMGEDDDAFHSKYADINQDGEINVTDVMLIVGIILN